VLTVCTFKWAPPQGYRSKFGPEAVIALRNMVRRHYKQPHRFVCITDDAKGLKDIETLPLWTDHSEVPSPNGPRNPSCYRRLKLFAPEMEALLGKRFVSMDLDTVVVGDLSPIFDRPEDFVIWGETDPRSFYNGSMFMQTAGARAQVWKDFNPRTSPKEAKKAGRFGSDQGWISHKLGPGEAMWGRQDGVYSYRVHIEPHGDDYLPENARLVMFHGRVDPWSWRGQRLEWVRTNWGIAA
jgi:hypothetical protein